MIDKNRVSKTAIEAYKRTLEPKNTKRNITYRERLIELLQKNDEAADKQIYDEYFCEGGSFRGWCLRYASTRSAISTILNMEYDEE